MAYVVVNVESQVRVRHPRTGRETYSTEASARAAMTRLVKIDQEAYLSGRKYPRTDYQVMRIEDYRVQVPMITVTNLMTQEPVTIPADTPWSCRPDSETYWSM